MRIMTKIKEKYCTAYYAGVNYNKLQITSCHFYKIESAQGWADFLNSEEQKKPKQRQKKHFVIQLHEDYNDD